MSWIYILEMTGVATWRIHLTLKKRAIGDIPLRSLSIICCSSKTWTRLKVGVTDGSSKAKRSSTLATAALVWKHFNWEKWQNQTEIERSGQNNQLVHKTQDAGWFVRHGDMKMRSVSSVGKHKWQRLKNLWAWKFMNEDERRDSWNLPWRGKCQRRKVSLKRLT